MKKKSVPIASKKAAAEIADAEQTPTKTAPKQIPAKKQPKKIATPKAATDTEATVDAASFTVVAIGASAGGLEAITAFLKNVSPTTGMAFIYVQHLSPNHKSLLTSILSKVTEMKVQEIDDMEKMKPDNVYVIPHNKEIEVTDGHIKLIPRQRNKNSNLSIDVLFSSLAEARKENVIGIVLSGSASDGTRGLKEIKLAGGITFAQDDSAKFTSMPHSAIAEGVVDFVLSPKEIAAELNWMCKHPLARRNATKTAPEDRIENSNPDLKAILQLLQKKNNVDFGHYKMSTIKRRILRRMLINKVKTLKGYTDLLAQRQDEPDLLYQDMLINVTGFFRDTEAFRHLKKTVLPALLKSKTTNETLRIWVAACATGEEVYSIAMLLLELQQNKTNKIPFQIFASDLSAQAIAEARNGEYSVQQLKNVSPKRLHQFFTKTKDKYRISKALRDVCVFAHHNVLQDPPFSRLDFVSCRNLLIYLDNSAQKRLIATFHYALNEGGVLMLGKSETIGTSDELFSIANKEYKIYTRKKKSGAYKIPEMKPRISQNNVSPRAQNVTSGLTKKVLPAAHNNIGSSFDAYLLDNQLPASVIINYDFDILQFRGGTEDYLKNTSGKASLNVLRMARPEITFELRNAIHHAIKTKKTVKKTGIEMNLDKDGTVVQIVNLEVSPLTIAGEDPMLVIVFTGQQMDMRLHVNNGSRNNSAAKDRRIKKLEEELAAARADMGSITQDQEAAYEELQSANEEIVSSNEELQSLNEELETSKEEIESTNEELITSNQELLARNQQVEHLYTYYEAILSTIHEPMLIIDKDIRIVSANKSFYKTFHVSEENSIGVSLYKLGDNQWNIPGLRDLIEDIVPKNIRFHDFEVKHVFPKLGRKIMLLNAHRITKQSNNEELIVLTIIDVTEVRRLALEIEVKEKKALEQQLEVEKKAMKLIEASNKRYNMMLMQSPFAFVVLKGPEMILTLVNDSMKEIWGKGKKIEGKSLYKVLPEIKGGLLPDLLNNVYATGVPYHGYEQLVPIRRDGKMEDVYFNFVYQPYRETDDSISGVTVIAYVVTEHVLAKIELHKAKLKAEIKTQIAENALKAKQRFLSNMSHEIRTPMNGIIGFANVVLKTKLDASQKEYITAIKTSGDALVVLINDILDLAKVNSGKMTFEQTPFNLCDSITAMLQLFETKIKEKQLLLRKEHDDRIPKILLGDSLRLRQILLNLVSNAVKFTSAGSITIKVRMLQEDADNATIEFEISDTGIGIPANRIEHIFNDFEQASKETSRSYGGTGLGLAIVKQLIELQGGTIVVKSEVDKGSVFSFTLNFRKSDTQQENIVPENAAPTVISGIENIKILVVEDFPMNQLLMKSILLDFGFQFDIAENGEIALSKMKESNYDMILMDMQMPVMNGFEATTYIRETMKSSIPIIALTADVTAIDVQKCRELGMTDYISKPIDEKLLYIKMMQYLKSD
ncbi:MAG: response regulator [Taibaiella sp.]|nr:response regulator [Taibaiella sp.]